MLTYSDFLNFLEMNLGIKQWAALITVIGIPLFFLKLFFWQARLKITFQPRETYHEVALVDDPNKPKSIWLQLMVENKGYELSKNTEAYLSKIWVKENNSYKKLKEFRAPVKLKWSHEEDIFPIDILPKESRRLDVCYIREDKSILYLMARGFPSGTIKNELPPGNYIFLVKVISENSLLPALLFFNVIWDGKWKTIKGSKYRTFGVFRKPKE